METTNPVAEVVSPEARLEAMFGGEGSKQAQAVEEREEEPVEEETTEGEEQEAEEEAVSNDDAEPEAESSEPETAEIELDGKKYAVPKELEGAFLKNRDYTQKTQEIAEKRRIVEEREQHLQQLETMRAATFSKAVAINAVEQRLQQFQQIDWNGLAATDTSEYLRLDRAHRELQQQHSQMIAEVQGVIAQEQQLSAQKRQQMLERGNAELRTQIQGWGPELGRKVLDSSKYYGFTDAELAKVDDPRDVRVLHDAMKWRELQESKATTVKKKVENAKPVTVKAARSAQTNQQAGLLDASRKQVKKTGDAKDAENYLTRLFESKRKR